MEMKVEASEYESRVRLKSLDFERLEFARVIDEPFDGHLKSTFIVEHRDIANFSESSGERAVRITLELAGHTDGREVLSMSLTLVGGFEICAADARQFEALLKYNTVAMMMPYIRSQVTLLTSQPGMTPLILPVFDVNKLVNGCTPEEAENE